MSSLTELLAGHRRLNRRIAVLREWHWPWFDPIKDEDGQLVLREDPECGTTYFDPMNDDEQAMALFRELPTPSQLNQLHKSTWTVAWDNLDYAADGYTLNEAICRAWIQWREMQP